MIEKINKVIEWAENKDLLKPSNSKKQSLKMISEAGEICDAICKDDKAELIDAIGDTLVTIIIFSRQKGMLQSGHLEQICNRSHDDSYSINCNLTAIAIIQKITKLAKFDNRNSDIMSFGNTYIKTAKIVQHLSDLAIAYDTTLEHCLDTAYDVISKRTGKTINGTFIKD